MPDQRIELHDDELIARIFTRYQNEKAKFFSLRDTDFARQMSGHSGISMLRLNRLNDNQAALEWFKSKKLKGLAVCKASKLKSLGLKFVSSESNPHLSVRCSSCNLATDYPILCKSSSSGCGLDVSFDHDYIWELTKNFEMLCPADPTRNPALSKLKDQITHKQIRLSEAFDRITAFTENRLSSLQLTWLNGERNCYVVSETLRRNLPADFKDEAPSGLAMDYEKAADEAGFPEYRLLKGKTYGKLPNSGRWHDYSDTVFGKCPHMEIQSIKIIEEHVLPKYVGTQKAGWNATVGNLPTQRVFEKQEYEDLLAHSEHELLRLIDRFLAE